MSRYWIHSAPEDYTEDSDLRKCSRGDRCSDPRPVEVNGRTVLAPALTPRAFCERDRMIIERSVKELPELWDRVHDEIGNKRPSHGPKVSSSKTAPVPISLPVDALLRQVVAVLTSWEERVRIVAGLTVLDTHLSRLRRDRVAVRTACVLLGAHLETLLSLDAEPMLRGVDLNELDGLPADASGMVRPTAGYADILLALDGADAGLEMLDLNYRCRSLLTETKAPARHLRVPCKACGFNKLYERRDFDDQPDGAMCRHCGTTYTDNEFTLHRGEVYAEQSAKRAVGGMRQRPLVSVDADGGSGRA